MEGAKKLLKYMEERRQKEREEHKNKRKAVAEEIKDSVKIEMHDAMKPWQEGTVRVSSPTITPTKSGRGLLAVAAVRDSGIVFSVISTPLSLRP